ncbi:hypothetical protein BESB_083390 [Besnoitia besnoiti]|uniref:Uncharacterized protein n=1 Tax=Besnoitia besnoiti TaxID=94643 RepID=A0A2A9MCL7_BESBE|nr:hypothetical protein BESB_083390 [Besnoitia besnoiti]PFH33140.1 hypothetical protein BESB_083390 [Besnoitia besnoiti]
MMYPASAEEEHVQFPYPFICPPRSLPGPPPGKERDILDPLKRQAESHGVLEWLLDARNNLRRCPEPQPRRIWGRVLSVVPAAVRESDRGNSDGLPDDFSRLRREHQRELRRQLRERYRELERQAQQNFPSQDGRASDHKAFTRRADESPREGRRPEVGHLSLAAFLRSNGDFLREARLRPMRRSRTSSNGSPFDTHADAPPPAHPQEALEYTGLEDYRFEHLSDDEVCVFRLGTRQNSSESDHDSFPVGTGSQGSTLSSSRSRRTVSRGSTTGGRRSSSSKEDWQSSRGRHRFVSNDSDESHPRSSANRVASAWIQGDEDCARLILPARRLKSFEASTEEAEAHGWGPAEESLRRLSRPNTSLRSQLADGGTRLRRSESETSALSGDTAPLSPLPRGGGHGWESRAKKRVDLSLDPAHLERTPPFGPRTAVEARGGVSPCGDMPVPPPPHPSLEASSRRLSFASASDAGGEFDDRAGAGGFPSNYQQLEHRGRPYPLSHHPHQVSLPSFARLPEHPFAPTVPCTPSKKVLPYTLKDLPDSPGPQKRPYRPAHSKIHRGLHDRHRDASARRRREGRASSSSRRAHHASKQLQQAQRPPDGLAMHRPSPRTLRSPGAGQFPTESAQETPGPWLECRRGPEQALATGSLARETDGDSGGQRQACVTRLRFHTSDVAPSAALLERRNSSRPVPARRTRQTFAARRGGFGQPSEATSSDRDLSEDSSFCGWVMSGCSNSSVEDVGRVLVS